MLFFSVLFGSEKFEPYVGDLAIATVAAKMFSNAEKHVVKGGLGAEGGVNEMMANQVMMMMMMMMMMTMMMMMMMLMLMMMMMMIKIMVVTILLDNDDDDDYDADRHHHHHHLS